MINTRINIILLISTYLLLMVLNACRTTTDDEMAMRTAYDNQQFQARARAQQQWVEGSANRFDQFVKSHSSPSRSQSYCPPNKR